MASSTLDDVKAFTSAHASAVNDVIVSICAGTLMAGLDEELEVLLS